MLYVIFIKIYICQLRVYTDYCCILIEPVCMYIGLTRSASDVEEPDSDVKRLLAQILYLQNTLEHWNAAIVNLIKGDINRMKKLCVDNRFRSTLTFYLLLL